MTKVTEILLEAVDKLEGRFVFFIEKRAKF